MVEIRTLLRRLGDEGRTVVVSSHLLSEIEAACDSLAIIRYGELLYSGPLSDLVAQAGECIEAVPEYPSDIRGLADLLRGRGWKATARDDDVHVSAPASQAADVNRAAAEVGITLLYGGVERSSLATYAYYWLNLMGIMTNRHDDVEGLKKNLELHFTESNLEVIGCGALFWGRV